jgi:hypothetical protein
VLRCRRQGVCFLTIQIEVGCKAAKKRKYCKPNKPPKANIPHVQDAERTAQTKLFKIKTAAPERQSSCDLARGVRVGRKVEAVCCCWKGLELGRRKLRAASKKDIGRQCRKI